MHGQEKRQLVFSHPLTVEHADTRTPSHLRSFSVAPETLHVLAAMVDFQEDNDSRTTGNGRFDLSATVDAIIDPPPHNSSYFKHHLTFLENYFGKSSHGKVIVKGVVLDSVYRLSHPLQ